MSEDVKAYATEKAQDLGIHFLTVLFDIALLGVWLAGEYCLEHFLVPRFKVDSLISVAVLWVFRVLFAVSTLIPFASKILKHVRIALLRDRAEVRQAKAKIASAEGAGEQQ